MLGFVAAARAANLASESLYWEFFGFSFWREEGMSELVINQGVYFVVHIHHDFHAFQVGSATTSISIQFHRH